MDVDPNDDRAWAHWRREWLLRPGVTYLNHGSFGPPPMAVRSAYREWQERLSSEPMDFFVREYEPELAIARQRVAEFVGAPKKDLVFVDNATYGMNVVASSVKLRAGDEVLLTDHEYGAVKRIWQRACDEAGARMTTVTLPYPIESTEQIVAAVRAAFTDNTRLFILSHITSPTAIVLPARELCAAARQAGVPTCIDGPHAVAALDLDLAALDCDYYVASGHKWLCAPFGSGFLYIHPRAQDHVRPPVLSWGRVGPAVPVRWDEEFNWLGTRDPAAPLSMPTAIDFFQSVGAEAFRARSHALVRYAQERLGDLLKSKPIAPSSLSESRKWYVTMVGMPLPKVDAPALQATLRAKYGIETPIVDWQGRQFVRTSCHLYNDRADIDRLVTALRTELSL